MGNPKGVKRDFKALEKCRFEAMRLKSPLSPREQRVSPDRPAVVQGAKRRSEPLTARTDLESLQARERGGEVYHLARLVFFEGSLDGTQEIR